MTSLWVLGGMAFILFPVALSLYLDHARWFSHIVWWIRERDFPMPQANWTVGDLRAHAVKQLHTAWYADPRWPSCDENLFLQRLIENLETRPEDSRLTPQEVGDWLVIRDLRGA